MLKNGHHFDALTLSEPNSKEDQVVYFNVDIPAKHGM